MTHRNVPLDRNVFIHSRWNFYVLWSLNLNCILIFSFFERERERESTWVSGGGAGRGRERILIPTPSTEPHLRAWSYGTGSSWSCGSWPEPQWSWTLNRLSHPGAPIKRFLRINIYCGSMISWFMSSSPALGSVLWQLRAWRLLLIPCLPLFLPLSRLCSLSFKNKQINIKILKKKHFINQSIALFWIFKKGSTNTWQNSDGQKKCMEEGAMCLLYKFSSLSVERVRNSVKQGIPTVYAFFLLGVSWLWPKI